MRNRKNRTSNSRSIQRSGSKPVTYPPSFHLPSYADACGWQPDRLRKASERAILTRHHKARILEKAHGRQPNIYRLRIDCPEVIYTIESDAVVIRGYSWEPDPESLEEFDGGWYERDPKWFLPD